MDGTTFKKFIQNLEDFVFIEDKIVTCVWLCQALKIHVNTAKQLLHAFVAEDEFKSKVSVTYLLGGQLKNGQGIHMKLIKDADRETTKELFSNIITDHIYSIQKSADAIDASNIFNSYPHFNVDTEIRQFCAVKPSKEIEKRNVKLVVVETKNEVKKTQPKEKEPEKNVSNKRELIKDEDGPPSKQTKISPEKNNKHKVTKGGIADMFSRQNEKKKTEPPPEKVEKKVEKAKPGGISSFFQKQAPKKKDAVEAMETEDEPAPIKETNVIIESKEKSVVEHKDEVNRKVDSQKSPKKEKKSKGKENRKKRKKKDEQEDESRKKRKRIASVFSSDSESSGKEESDVEMEPDPLPVSVPIQKEDDEDIIPPTPGRKRVRKQIDKTYTDEEGFILTKKEYVYESCTDDEEPQEKNMESKETLMKKESKPEEKANDETKPTKVTKAEEKKPSSKKSPVKKKSPVNNKSNQASIMSFFKKK